MSDERMRDWGEDKHRLSDWVYELENAVSELSDRIDINMQITKRLVEDARSVMAYLKSAGPDADFDASVDRMRKFLHRYDGETGFELDCDAEGRWRVIFDDDVKEP